VSDDAAAPPGDGAKKRDVILVHGVSEDGEGVNVIRQREDRLELGTVLPVREGKPLRGDLVKLTPRKELPLLYDVEVQYEARPSSSGAPAEEPPPKAHAGPARVTTSTYRAGWDRIWGSSGKKRLPN
jgi:hypothetical protein